MGKTGVLGALEELVLLAVVHGGEEAYAVTVRRELSERTGSDVTMGAVYGTLDRLEAKGLLASRTEAVTEREGPGRPRRYYALTADGVAALDEGRRIRATMWDGVRLPDPSEAS